MKKLSKRKVKERRKVGIVKAYMSRAAAVRKLQLPLSDFRRLCILKGVYPVEPKNKSKLTGGNTRRKTYYFTRDIQSLTQEPILFKFWEFKVFMKRLTKAKGRHDVEKFQNVLDNKPVYTLDSVVKERYPRFVDALRDCDDSLSMCFLFAMFPKTRGKPDDLIDLSKRLTTEFMHYVIHTKSLRKVFISIKGYYYQAEIMGQTVTWIVPHQFVIDRTSNVDMNVMKTFTEFYITLLGFINFKLYKSINATYPPNIGDDNLNCLIGIMENKSVVKADQDGQELDVFDEDFEEDEKSDTKEDKKMSFQEMLKLENIFTGCKFFLNREVPRESLTFIIRSFGGQVSWDKNLAPGATYDESDTSITHHIIDRSSLTQQKLDRVYIQPQWVYDSINMRMLLPTDEYLIGATLPPHLSPFVNEKRGDYVPPDKRRLLELRKQFEADKAAEERVKNGEAGVESELETDTEMEKDSASESEASEEERDIPAKRRRLENGKASKAEKNSRKRERDSNKSTARSKMEVKRGKVKFEDRKELMAKEDAEHRKMGIMMIPKKKKRLFDKITKTQRQRNTKKEKLEAKRRVVDDIRSRRRRNK